MSYTLTIDEPKAAEWLEKEQALMAPGELGLLFVAFLAQRRGSVGKVAPMKVLRRRAKRRTLPPLTRRLGGLLKPEKPLPSDWDYHDVLLDVFEVEPLDRDVLSRAADSHNRDYEDDVQLQTAIGAGCTRLFTRNPKHFENEEVNICSPDQFKI